MNCKEFRKNIIFFIEDKEENKLLKSHVENCRDCFLILEQIRQDFLLQEKERELEINPFFYTRLQQKMVQHETIAPSSVFYRAGIPALVLAAAIIVGIAIGSVFYTTQNDRQQNFSSFEKEFFLDDEGMLLTFN
jgi:hypothetical protein